MAEVRLNVFLKDKDSGEFKKVIAQVNPNCRDEKLVETVTALNNLTSNKIKDIWKVIDKYLKPDDDWVSEADLKKILQEKYTPVEVDDDVTESDIVMILKGEYTPQPDADSWSEDDFKF